MVTYKNSWQEYRIHMEWLGTRLLFKFRSGVNEDLDRHRGREGNYVLCMVLSVRVLCMCCES